MIVVENVAPTLIIAPLEASQLAWLDEGCTAMGWHKPQGYFRACLDQQLRRIVCVLVARMAHIYAGHVKLAWMADYEHFAREAIPEVQDLNVIPALRRRGIGGALLAAAETLASERTRQIGIGVGLSPAYGAALRLYVKRGYVPDGRPLTYHGAPVHERQRVRLDDDLILHLVKSLG